MPLKCIFQNRSDSKSLDIPSIELVLKPGNSYERDLETVANLDALLFEVTKNLDDLSISFDGQELSGYDVFSFVDNFRRTRLEPNVSVQQAATRRLYDPLTTVHDLRAKLLRARTLIPRAVRELQGSALDQQKIIEDWAGLLEIQVEEIEALLTDPPSNALGETYSTRISSAISNIGELEDYLVSRTRKSIKEWFTLQPDPREPFLEDTRRVVNNISVRVGNLNVRLDELAKDKIDDITRNDLKEKLKEVDVTLSRFRVTVDPVDLNKVRGTLQAIEHSLPLPNELLAMIWPILGVLTLQGLLMWGAVKIGPGFAPYLGMDTPEILSVIIIAGTLGSLVRVIWRAVTHQYQDRMYRSYPALYLIGLVRPLLGAVMALAVFVLFNSSFLAIPLVNPIGDPVVGTFNASQLFLILVAFLAGFSDEWLLKFGALNTTQR